MKIYCCVLQEIKSPVPLRRAALCSQLKSKVGNILAKTAALCSWQNFDGTPVASKSHTHPSHSTTSRLLTSSLSLGVPFPRSKVLKSWYDYGGLKCSPQETWIRWDLYDQSTIFSALVLTTFFKVTSGWGALSEERVYVIFPVGYRLMSEYIRDVTRNLSTWRIDTHRIDTHHSILTSPLQSGNTFTRIDTRIEEHMSCIWYNPYVPLCIQTIAYHTRVTVFTYLPLYKVSVRILS